MYDSNTILEIYWFGTKSWKFDKEVMLSRLWNYYWEVAVIRMWLNKKEAEDMKKYIDKNLIWISYDLPWIWWSTYCSKLVRQAHKYSWKKVDLDDDWWIVWPYQLLKSDNVWKIEYFSY